MRALIVAFYVVVGLFLISTMVYLAQAEKAVQAGVKKELVVSPSLRR